MSILFNAQSNYVPQMGNVAENIAVNVSTLRKEKGWTQEMLAEFAGLSQNAIAQIEGQNRWPERETVSKLAKALGIFEEQLFIAPWYTTKPTIAQALAVIAEAHGLEVSPPKRKRKKKD